MLFKSTLFLLDKREKDLDAGMHCFVIFELGEEPVYDNLAYGLVAL